MPGDGERYDVVVVGVQGDDADAADLRADLSALTGLSAAKVSLALRDGELIVHRALADAEARRAAAALRRRGVDVQIRSIHEGPDIDAMLGGAGLLLPHAGGAPAPIAPPPEFGGAARARSIDIGARSSSAAPGLLDPSRPQGRPSDMQSERPFAGAFEKAAGRARPTPREPVARQPAPAEPSNGEPKKKVRDNYVGTPRRSKPEPRGVTGQIADAQRLAASLEAAAESAEAIEVVTLDGQSSESVEVKLGAPAGASADSTSASASARSGAASDSAPRRSGPPDERIAVDFGSGMRARAEPAAASSSSSSGSAASVSAPRGEAPPFAARSTARPVTFRGAAPAPSTYGPAVGRRPLFSSDRIANYSFGVAVGLAIGMLIAFVAVRVFSRGDVHALEDELAVSYSKPLQVERGDARPPAAILDDLEAAYARSRWFFLLTMILAGVPAGLGLGYFRR